MLNQKTGKQLIPDGANPLMAQEGKPHPLTPSPTGEGGHPLQLERDGVRLKLKLIKDNPGYKLEP
jgi:hypothetical protein